jgi:predicted amidohydrolase YtcJ
VVADRGAQLEHMIMCEYLYAEFSLKEGEDEGLSAEQAETVERWRKLLRGIAVEEMLHLALVSNVMASIGAAPTFTRPNFPQRSRYFPASIQLDLLPFGERALKHFLYLERPEGMERQDAEGFVPYAPPREPLTENELMPRGQEFLTIGHLYRGVEDGMRRLTDRLGERAVFVGSPRAQATPELVSWPQLIAVTGLDSALAAVSEIIEQGEGARGDWQNAHYGRFLAIWDEYQTPTGEWIRTNSAWHELNLAERRFPTRWELDEVAPDNPVLIKRGGHNDVCNSLALKLGGIGRDTPDPPGGKVFRDASGEPTGLLLETPAFASVEAAMPHASVEEQVENLALASQDYARNGLCAVRDCAVEPRGEIELLQAVHDRGRLAVRTRYLILATAVGSVDERIELLDTLKVRSDTGDAMLRVWGLKVILDGGAEGGATCEPYANDPDEHGILIWNADELAQLADYALKNGWRLGTHAVGDRAVRVTLQAYERALAANPGTPPGSLVIEHGFLVGPEQRARAIRLGIPVTIQHPLLFTLAAELIQNWGPERAREVMPVSEWIREGALIAAGSDYPVGPYHAMRSVWGMVTRQTGGAGVLGPEHAVDRETAIRLYTTEAVRLLGEQDERGTLEPGKLADFAAYPADPFTCELDELAELDPALTVVAGHASWDPEARM